MNKFVTLRDFKPSELIFDADESLEILRFIFPSKAGRLNTLPVDDHLRSFAQGLLLEAVDASFSLGFVHALIRPLAGARRSLRSILLKFARSAAGHWLRHATVKDLNDIKIYEIVRRDLEWGFGRIMDLYLEGIAANTMPRVGVVAYRLGSTTAAWG